MATKTVLVDGKKLCQGCKEYKPLIEFVTAVNTTTGKASKCKLCINNPRKTRYKTDAEYKKYVDDHNRKSKLKIKYGLSVGDYEHLLNTQQNKCIICSTEFDNHNKNKAARVDHNHKTGEVRGLLCATCNVGLGYFKDNEVFLMNASQYLKDHS